MANVVFENQEFLKEFRARVARSKRTLPEVTNDAAMRIAVSAVNLTRKADKTEIELLGISGYRILSDAKGKNKNKFLKKPKPIYSANLRMRDIVVGRYINRYGMDAFREKFSAPGKVADVTLEEFKSRRKGRAFLSSGWIWCVRRIASAMGGRVTANTTGVQSFGKPKGRAFPARDGWNPVCTFINSAAKNDKALAVVEKGLRQAFDAQTAEWKAYAEKKLNQALS